MKQILKKHIKKRSRGRLCSESPPSFSWDPSLPRRQRDSATHWRVRPFALSLGPPCSPWRCHWARRVVLWPLALSLSPPSRRWPVRVVVEPAVASFGPWRRRRVHCVVVGPFTLPSGPLCRRRALRRVVEPAVLSLGPSRCRSAHRVVVWVFASSSGPPCRGWAVRVFVEPAVSLLGPPCLGLLAPSSGFSRHPWTVPVVLGLCVVLGLFVRSSGFS